MFEFKVLGPLEVLRDGELLDVSARKQRAILALLLIAGNQVVSLDRLIDQLWGEEPPPRATGSLQAYISNLRRVLEPGRMPRASAEVLVSRPPGYLLVVDPAHYDVTRFEAVAVAGQAELAQGRPQAAHDVLTEALGLWRGPAMGEFASEGFARPEAARLEELRAVATEARLHAALALRRHASAVAELQSLVAEHPLRETLWEALIVALYRSGRQSDALSAYTRVRHILAEELGVEPGPALRRLEVDVLAQAASLDWHPPGEERPTASIASAAGPSLTLPVPTAEVPRQLPAYTAHFVGRTEELQRLTALANTATQGGMVVISAIAGTAGIGKTTLALHWAHQAADRFPDGQLYVNLRGFDPTSEPMHPAEAIRGFLDAFEIPPERIPASLDAQAALYRSLLANRKVLIVLDNARDAEQVRPLLPGSSTCLVVVTSRNQLASLVAQEGARPVALDVLSPEECSALLSSHVGHSRATAEPKAIVELVEHCARLPLALAILAARAAMNPRFPLGVLAEELRTERRLDALDTGELGMSLRAVFSWSYRPLTTAARRVFRVLGLHPGPDISLDAAASLAGVSVPGVRALLTELTRVHLLDEYLPGRFRFHDLLRAYATERLEAEDAENERDAALQRVLTWYLYTADAAHRVLLPQLPPVQLDSTDAVSPQLVFETYGQAKDWYDAERANLIAATRRAADAGQYATAWKLPLAMLGFFNLRRAWADLVKSYSIGLSAARHLHDDSGEAWLTASLGHAHRELQRFDEAADYSRQSLAICRKIGFRWGEGAALYNLGSALRGLRRFEEALDSLQQAMDIFRETGNRQGEGRNLTALGDVYRELGQLNDALACYEQALPIYREIGDRQGEGVALEDLGTVYRELRRLEEALDCFRRAQVIHSETGDQQGAAQTLNSLGQALHDAGQPNAARECWHQALAMFEELGDPHVADIRAHLNTLDPEFSA